MFSNTLKFKDLFYKTQFIITILVLISGCLSKKTSQKRTPQQLQEETTTNNSNNNWNFNNIGTPTPTPDPGTGGSGSSHGTGNEPGVNDGGQVIEYYKINNPPIVLHGANDGQVVWSSESHLPAGISQEVLTTDARLNVRVIPRRQYFGVDSKGVSCLYQPRPYQKLQVGVQIRKRESPSASGYYLFDNVAVNGASRVHEFTVPENTNYPVIIEILNVKWDYTCQYYANQGFPNVEGYCPWDKIWSTECVQIELQFSTDGTTDIPGNRTY